MEGPFPKRLGYFFFGFIAILIFFISPFDSKLESTPGQPVPGFIILGDSLTSEDFIVPLEINFDDLRPGNPPIRKQGSVALTFPGNSQRPWSIKVKADDMTGGHMTEFDVSNNNYIENGKQLTDPMFAWINENNKVDLSKGEQLLISGTGSGTFPVYFEQAAVWGDAALPQSREYHMTVIFTLS